MKTNQSILSLKFRNVRHKEGGKMTIEISVTDCEFVEVSNHVIDVNIPFLMRLIMMTKLKMIIDYDSDTATSKLDG